METNFLNDFPGAAAAPGPAFNIAIYTIISMFVVVGIAHLVARVMHNRRLGEWARNEFVEVFISAIIVGGLFTLMNPDTGIIIQAFNSLVPSESVTVPSFGNITVSVPPLGIATRGCGLAGVPDGCLCFAYNYLSLLSREIGGLIGGLLILNFGLDTLSKFAIDLIVVEITPLAGISSIVMVINSAIQSLIFLGVLALMQMMLLVFISKTALTVFLPMGAVLRCFFGTRRVGGALIALSVGGYLIFPLTMAVNAVATQELITSGEMKPLQDLYGSVEGLKLFGGASFASSADYISGEKWLAYLDNIRGAIGALSRVLQEIPATLTSIIAALALQVTLLPVLSVMITVLAIKELAGLFGSEINLSRFEV